MFHFDGQRFSRGFSSVTTDNLTILAATGAGDVWFGGGKQLLRWDGAALGPAPNPPSSVTGLFFLSPELRWAVSGGSVARWNGTQWMRLGTYSTTYGGPHGLWGTGPDNLWTEDSYLARWNGTAWVDHSNLGGGGPSGVRALWGTAADDVWAAGSGPVAWRYDGAGWIRTALRANALSPAVTAGVSRDRGDVWLVGERGEAWHWNGAEFTEMAVGVDTTLTGVALRAEGVFAVGETGTVVLYRSGAWEQQASGTELGLRAIGSGAAGADLWAIGDGGTILRRAP